MKPILVNWTRGQQEASTVFEDEAHAIALRDALLAKYPVESHTMSDEIVVSATGVGEAFARKDHRIAQLEAQVTEMQDHSAAAFVREVTQRMNRLDPQEYPEFYDVYELVAHKWGIDVKETGDE